MAPARYWAANQKRKNAEAQYSSTKTVFGQIMRCRTAATQGNKIPLQYLNLRRPCSLSTYVGATFDFRLESRHVDRIPWIPLETLRAMFNGPNRLRFIESLEPRAAAFDPDEGVGMRAEAEGATG